MRPMVMGDLGCFGAAIPEWHQDDAGITQSEVEVRLEAAVRGRYPSELVDIADEQTRVLTDAPTFYALTGKFSQRMIHLMMVASWLKGLETAKHTLGEKVGRH